MGRSVNFDYQLPPEFIEKFERNQVCLYGYGFLGKWVHKFFRDMYGYTLPIFDRESKQTPYGLTSHLEELSGYPGLVILSCRHHIIEVSSKLIEMNVNWVSADDLFLRMLCSRRELVISALSHDPPSLNTYFALEKILSVGAMVERKHLVGNQYFEPPEFFPTFSESFLDAGAYCGDTLERFVVENLGTFESYIGFEPGDRQFEALSLRAARLAREWALTDEKIILKKMGLGSRSTFIAFDQSSHDVMSHSFIECDETDSRLEITSLDEFLSGRRVTFLKSDIEGMDFEFLMGAKETISKDRPKMALSCYHYPTDLTEMIIFISDLSLGYKFKLRHHANVIGDYVLYVY